LSPKHPASLDVGKSPLGVLRFLYVGSSDVRKDLDYYTKILGARKIWDFTSMGNRVAGINVSSGPLLLLARPSSSPVRSTRVRGREPEGYGQGVQESRLAA